MNVVLHCPPSAVNAGPAAEAAAPHIRKHGTVKSPKLGRAASPAARDPTLAPSLLQAPVVDFQWNPHDPWTFFSVADEAGEGGGGTLQVRLSVVLTRAGFLWQLCASAAPSAPGCWTAAAAPVWRLPAAASSCTSLRASAEHPPSLPGWRCLARPHLLADPQMSF